MSKSEKKPNIHFGDFKSKTDTCTVEYDGEVIEIEFYKNFWTSEIEETYFDGPDRYSIKNNKIVASAAVRWNFTDGDAMVPITEENLSLLDSYLVAKIVDAMIASVNPKKQTSQA